MKYGLHIAFNHKNYTLKGQFNIQIGQESSVELNFCNFHSDSQYMAMKS